MSEEKKTSPWVYLGIGCAVLVVLCVVVVGGLAFWGFRFIKGMAAENRDPVARLEKVKSLLGCKELPEGYHAMMGLSVPFLMDIAILSDREVVWTKGAHSEHPKKPFDSRGFIYVKTFTGKNDKELQEYLEGKSENLDSLKVQKLDLDAAETIGRGSLQQGTMAVRYVAQRGTIRLDRSPVEGVLTVMSLECPGEGHLRLGLWFGPDPHPKDPVKEVDFSKTPADPAEIQSCLSHFAPCEH